MAAPTDTCAFLFICTVMNLVLATVRAPQRSRA